MKDHKSGPMGLVLEQLMQVTRQGYWHIDKTGISLDVNPAMCQILGYPREDIIGRPIFDFVDAPNEVIFRKAVAAREQGAGGNYEVSLTRGDGSSIPCFNTATPVTDDNGQRIGSIGLFTDISEIKQTEEALRESEKRFRDFAETASDWFWETDADLRYLDFFGDPYKTTQFVATNAEGRTRQEMLDITLTAREKTNTEKWSEHLADLEVHRPFRNLVYERILPSGDIAWTRSSGEPIFDSEGQFTGYRGSASDATEDIRANAELAQFQNILNQTEDAVFSFDPDSLLFTYVNQGAMDQVGYSRAELLAMTPVDVKPGYNETSFRDMIAPLISHETESLRFETIHKTKDNKTLPVEIVLQYFDREDQGAPRFFAIVRDITEQKLAEQEARKREARLQEDQERLDLSIKSAGIGTFLWHIKNDTHYWDERSQEIWGFDPGTYAGNVEADFKDRLHPDDVDRVFDRLSRVFSGLEEFDMEYRIIRPNGDQAHIHAAATLLCDEQGQPEKLIGVSRDITRRVETLEKVRQSEAQTQSIMDNVPVLINFLDPRQRIIFCNATTEKWYNMPKSEIIGKTIAELFDQPMFESLRPHVEAVLAGEEARFQKEIAYPDGQTRFVNIAYLPHVDADSKEVTAYIVLNTDITGMKQIEADLVVARDQAEHANQAKSEFLANMSHELRTPLNAISGYSQMVEMQPYGPVGDNRYIEYVNHIRESGDHLLDIIDDILDLTRIEAGKMRIEEDDVEPGEIIRSCLRFLNSRISEKNLTITTPPDDTWPVLRVDPRMLRQMLLNLLSNAMKFSLPNSSIEVISQREDSGGLAIIVADTGIGMSEDEIVVALERFGQVESILSRSNEGTGLGLPMVRSQIELHGGSFMIESEKGTGTRVGLVFPQDRVADTIQ